MIINKDSLRRDTIQLLKQIDTQIAQVKKKAEEMGVEPEELQNSSGWVMTPLLLAKAQAYHTLVLLQT